MIVLYFFKIIITIFLWSSRVIDASQYAHYVFNTMKRKPSGKISFEVSDVADKRFRETRKYCRNLALNLAYRNSLSPILFQVLQKTCRFKLYSKFFTGIPYYTVESVERIGGGEAAVGVRTVRSGRRWFDKQGGNAGRCRFHLRDAWSLHTTANPRTTCGRSRACWPHLPRECYVICNRIINIYI